MQQEWLCLKETRALYSWITLLVFLDHILSFLQLISLQMLTECLMHAGHRPSAGCLMRPGQLLAVCH